MRLDAWVCKIYKSSMSAVPAMPEFPASQAATYCERALSMMRTLNVLPTPKHYALFFAVAAGQPTTLVKAVETLIEKKAVFTDEILDNLYNEHIGEAQGRAMQETAAGARKILAEMMQSVAAFTGTTQSVGQEVAHTLEKIGDGEMTEESLRLMAKVVVDSAKSMKDSSESVTKKLANAQGEIANLKENLTKATVESEKDFLTGTFNRKAFDKRLLEAIQEANSKDQELALLVIDIDHFKKFNDNFGHQIGDEVLKIVAKTLTDSVKGMDTVARFGGEEFCVILPRTPVGGGMIVAEGIRKAIASRELKNKSTGANYGQITVSIGVAAFRQKVDAPESIIKRADEALYRSKHAGRNRVTQENLAE